MLPSSFLPFVFGSLRHRVQAGWHARIEIDLRQASCPVPSQNPHLPSRSPSIVRPSPQRVKPASLHPSHPPWLKPRRDGAPNHNSPARTAIPRYSPHHIRPNTTTCSAGASGVPPPAPTHFSHPQQCTNTVFVYARHYRRGIARLVPPPISGSGVGALCHLGSGWSRGGQVTPACTHIQTMGDVRSRMDEG